jgi:septal ring factor EnvC (AmiA/AmiB activator)
MVLEAACRRLEAAIDRLETALATRDARERSAQQQLDASLQAAQAERADLTEVNRTTLERLDQTIGRLRGLLAPG